MIASIRSPRLPLLALILLCLPLLAHAEQLNKFAGDNQTGDETTTFDPLVVILEDDSGSALVEELLSWRVLTGSAVFLEDQTSTTSSTGGKGDSSMQFWMGDAQTSTIQVTHDRSGTSVIFTVNPNVQPVATTLEIVSGDGQSGAPGDTLQPLVIRASSDDGGELEPAMSTENARLSRSAFANGIAQVPVEGETITWQIVPAENARFDGAQQGASITTQTDVDGLSAVSVVLQSRARTVVTATPQNGSANPVSFVINSSGFVVGGLGRNQGRTFDALIDACDRLNQQAENTAAGEDLLDTCRSIATLDDENAASVIDRLTPNQIAAMGSLSIDIGRAMLTNLHARLMVLRQRGDRRLHLAGLKLNVDGLPLAAGEWLESYLDGEKRGGAAGSGQNLASPWGTFVNGEISYGDKDSTALETGLEFDIPAITAGIDYRYAGDLVLGAAFGYANTDSDFVNDAGTVAVQSFSLMLYGTWYQHGGWFADAVANIALNQYDTSRRVGVSQHALGDTDGVEAALDINAGFNGNFGGWQYTAYGRAGFLGVDIDGFVETPSDPIGPGAGSTLMYAAQRIESLVAVAGGSLSYTMSLPFGVLVPQVMVEAEHEFADDARRISAAFVHDPSTTFFGIATDSPDRDYMRAGLSLHLVMPHGRSAFVAYEQRFMQEGVEFSAATAGLRFEF